MPKQIRKNYYDSCILKKEDAFRLIKERGHSAGPPPVVSDGWGGIREAMLEVFETVPEYSRKGRPPSKKRPLPGWKCSANHQASGMRKGSFLGTRRRAVHGSMHELDEIFGKSTAFIERGHLTMRTFSSRLTRKGIAFSKNIDMHQAAAAHTGNGGGLERPYLDVERGLQHGCDRKTTLNRVTAQNKFL